MSPRRRGARLRLTWYRVTTRPVATCLTCTWRVAASWELTGRQLRDQARAHARDNVGHTVNVNTLDRAVYRYEAGAETRVETDASTDEGS